VARKTRKRGKKERKLELTVKDFIFPGETASYWTGVAGVAIIFAWLAVMGFFLIKPASGKHLWYIPLEVMAYPILAVIIGNMLAARPRMKELKRAGRQAKVMGNNYPELHRTLVRDAQLLGLKKAPDVYVVRDDKPIVFSIPGAKGSVIASTGLLAALTPQEFEVLLAHELAHIRCKHVRVDLAMTFIRSANPAVKIILLPVLLLMFFARAWPELIEFTADRGSLLVLLRPALLNSALVKFAVVADPNAGITMEELQAFLDSSGDIETDAAQMERHFKVGQFMSTQPHLRERIEQITEFPQTDQGKAALEKMAEIQGVSLAEVFVSKAKRADLVEEVQEDREG